MESAVGTISKIFTLSFHAGRFQKRLLAGKNSKDDFFILQFHFKNVSQLESVFGKISKVLTVLFSMLVIFKNACQLATIQKCFNVHQLPNFRSADVFFSFFALMFEIKNIY